MSVLGGKAVTDITAKTDFDPVGLREHSRDLPIAALVTDRAMEAWYHPSIARMTPSRRVTWQATSDDENS